MLEEKSLNIDTNKLEKETKMTITHLTKKEKKYLETLKSKEGKSINQIIKDCFGDSYDPKTKHVICVQGSSSSGKSTLSQNLYKLLNEKNIPCFLLELDRYYKSLTEKEIEKVHKGKYDFDNPASLDWSKINNVLKGLHNNDEYLNLYEYSFITKQSVGPIKTKNIYPSVIIIEGIYAFNTLNKKIFNVKEFTPLNSEKKIKNEFIWNRKSYPSFKILNVKMSMCRGKSLKVRIARDVMSRGKEKKSAIDQFEKQVWPATKKWVNNCIYKSHFSILHGSFNEKKVRLFVGGLTLFFVKECVVFENMVKDGNFNKEAMVECSGECAIEEGTELLLRED